MDKYIELVSREEATKEHHEPVEAAVRVSCSIQKIPLAAIYGQQISHQLSRHRQRAARSGHLLGFVAPLQRRGKSAENGPNLAP